MPKEITLEGPPILDYSGHVVCVYDAAEQNPEIRWLPEYTKQGFARRERTIQFVLLEDAGIALVTVFSGWPEDIGSATRAIAVPLEATTGEVHIEGLEEWPEERYVKVVPGRYTVVLLQRMDQEGNQLVLDFFLDSERVSQESLILKADERLRIPTMLLENAESLR